MTPELKARWVQALRSGDYKQGFRGLRDEERDGTCTHCCLGVLADLINPSGWFGRNWCRSESEEFDDNYASYAPLPSDIMDEKDQHMFARMNDDDGMSFKQIAAYVEGSNL